LSYLGTADSTISGNPQITAKGLNTPVMAMPTAINQTLSGKFKIFEGPKHRNPRVPHHAATIMIALFSILFGKTVTAKVHETIEKHGSTMKNRLIWIGLSPKFVASSGARIGSMKAN